ncbi:MAG: CPBP family intramembrane glutamic endopeptidase, partial [Gemmataceae bacterium]
DFSATPPPPLLEDEPPLVEPPLVRPRKPGPGILMSIAWWFVLLAAQLVIGIAAAVVLAVIAIVRLGPQFKEAFQANGPKLLFDQPGAFPILFLSATGGTLLVGAALVLLMHRSHARRRIALRGFSPLQALLVILLVPPVLLVGSEISTLASRVLRPLHLNDPAYEKLATESWPMVLFLGCILPAAGEELFFRGFLSRGLVARHGVILGTIFTSLLFGLMHVDPPQVVGTAILAVAMQYVYLNMKSLLAPILLHALNNSLAFGLMKLANDPQTRAKLGAEDNAHVPLLLVGAAVAAVVGLAWLIYQTRTRWVLPDGRVWSPGYVTAEMPSPYLDAVPRPTAPRAEAVAAALLGYAWLVGALVWELRK